MAAQPACTNGTIVVIAGLSSRRYEVTEKNLNETDTKIYDTKLTIKTPDGVQVVVNRGSPNNPGTIHLKREVETAEGLKVAT